MGKPVIHWQIMTKDPEKAQTFYSQLFGWKMDDNNPLKYTLVDTQAKSGIQGGIWKIPPEAENRITIYVQVEDLPTYINKAKALGARVLVPPQSLPLPNGDAIALIQDPTGLVIGLVKEKSQI